MFNKTIFGNHEHIHIINHDMKNVSSVKSKVYFIALTALLVGGFPNFMIQEADAAVTGVTYDSFVNDDEASANFTLDYTVADDGANTATAGTITFTRTGGTADATAHSYTMAAGNYATGAVSITRATLEADGGFNTLVDGTIYTIVVSITETGGPFTATVTGITYDTSAPTMVSASVTSSTTIDVTFSEDILDAEAGDFTLDSGLTIAGIAEVGGVVTITTNEAIADGVNPTITLGADFVTDLIDEGTVNTAIAGTVTVGNNDAVVDTTGGSSGNKHNTKPTFGLDPKTNFQLIEDGFSFNGVPTDISDNHWTPYEQQTIKLGELNEFETKVFASQKLRVQEFLFGIPVVGEAHKAELGVEVHYDHSGEIEEIIVIQKTDIIDIDSVQIENIKSKCRADSSDELCVTTQLQMQFLEPLQGNVMAMKAIDFKGRSQVTYLNDGFDISGDSLNPMKTMMIIGTEKYEGLIKVTQIAKYSDVWVAEDGRAFEMNEYYTPKLINQSIQDKIDTRNNLDRYHSNFADYKELQAQNAIEQLLEICPTCLDSFTDFDDSFAYEIPNELNALDNPEIIQRMILENERAQKIMNYLLDPVLQYR